MLNVGFRLDCIYTQLVGVQFLISVTEVGRPTLNVSLEFYSRPGKGNSEKESVYSFACLLSHGKLICSVSILLLPQLPWLLPFFDSRDVPISVCVSAFHAFVYILRSETAASHSHFVGLSWELHYIFQSSCTILFSH